MTLELGPETALGRLARERRDLVRHGFTALDARILKEADRSVWELPNGLSTQARAQRLARLKTLDRLGLATQKRAASTRCIRPSPTDCEISDVAKRLTNARAIPWIRRGSAAQRKQFPLFSGTELASASAVR